MFFCNQNYKNQRIVPVWALICVVCVAMPSTAIGAQSAASRAMNHFEKSLKIPAVVKSKDEGAFKSFIKSAKKNLSTNVVARRAVLLDLNIWIDAKPHSEITARALMLRADIYRQSNRSPEALIDWLRVKTLFPSSSHASKARKLAAESIQKGKYKRDHEMLKSLLNRQAKGKISYRHARMLKSMSDLTYAGFREPLAHACRGFLVNYRGHELAPMVQKLLADNRAREDIKEAVFQYEALVAIYPRSSYVADALVAAADIKQARLGKPEEAIRSYQRVVRDHPKRSAAQRAYLHMATTYERHLRDEAKAIDTLKKLVRKYPRTAEASKGNEALGRLYEKTKQYKAAVTAYRNMINVSRDSDAIIASLEKAAFLASGKLDDYKLMVKIDHQLCRSYPKQDACAEAYFRNGKAYEKQLRQPEKAISEYQMLVKKFPEHRLAKRAGSRVKSLKKGGSGLNFF